MRKQARTKQRVRMRKKSLAGLRGWRLVRVEGKKKRRLAKVTLVIDFSVSCSSMDVGTRSVERSVMLKRGVWLGLLPPRMAEVERWRLFS